MSWMTVDFLSVVQYWAVFAKGLALTLAASLLALAMALALGAGLALGRLSRSRVVPGVACALIEATRDLPFMVSLFLVCYLLPAAESRLPAFGVGVLRLGI